MDMWQVLRSMGCAMWRRVAGGDIKSSFGFFKFL